MNIEHVDLSSYKTRFTHYTSPVDYKKSGCKYCVPMTAKELEDSSDINSLNDFIAEEKLDGTRGILQFFNHYTRCFSRRISTKTNWFSETTDSLPHIRDLDIPFLKGTIIDGELFIPDRPFKDVSSTLNCTYDKAIERQKELGAVVFNAFDILYYQGVCLERMPLSSRKRYLKLVIDEVKEYCLEHDLFCPICEVPYFVDNIDVVIDSKQMRHISSNKSTYPHLSKSIMKLQVLKGDKCLVSLSKQSYYEYIVMNGGEGLMLKPLNGRYYHKRSKEFLKVKKFLTRDVIVVGFTFATREYKGIFPKDRWLYWENEYGVLEPTEFAEKRKASTLIKEGYTPVSKFYYYDYIATVRFGVVITDEEISKLSSTKKHIVHDVFLPYEYTTCKVLEVGECSGFTEEEREKFSEEAVIGNVIEVKANDIFKDTGKLRHPRFNREREDKSPLDCTFSAHINE